MTTPQKAPAIRIPRSPNAVELRQLAAWLGAQGHDKDWADGMAASAAVAVFDDYCTDCPGYAGKLMSVVWSGSPSFFDVFTWVDGNLVRSGREFDEKECNQCGQKNCTHCGNFWRQWSSKAGVLPPARQSPDKQATTDTKTPPARCEGCGNEVDPWNFGMPLAEALEHRLAEVRQQAVLKRDLDRFQTMTREEKIRLAMDVLWDVNETWDNDSLEDYPEELPSFDEYLSEIGSKLYAIRWKPTASCPRPSSAHATPASNEPSAAFTKPPFYVGLSQADGVYGGENHYAILAVNERGIVADIEGGLTSEAKATSEFIVRACNVHDELLEALEDVNESLAWFYEADHACAGEHFGAALKERMEIAIANANGKASTVRVNENAS